MNRTISSAYWLGDTVYLRVRKECQRGIVTAVEVRPGGSILYRVSWDDGETPHFDIELSSEFTMSFEVN